MGQRHHYQYKVAFIQILYMKVELIMLNFMLIVAKTNKKENILGIHCATSLYVI